MTLREIRFSVGTSATNLGRATNKRLPLPNFVARFKEVHRTPEKRAVYAKLSDAEQKELKGRNGWWFRTHIDGKKRNRRSGQPSDLVTLDFDYPTREYFEAVRTGKAGIPWRYFIHTSRSHTPEKPRFRLVMILNEPVDNELYMAVSRIAAQRIDPDMAFVDKVSFRPAQMMFMPTTSKDGEFVFADHTTRGEDLDWQALLDEFALIADWRDVTQLPRCAGEKSLRESSEKAENPTEKDGPVGFFCRAYTVMDAIEAFDLPYEPVDVHSAKPRYTYTGGTTVNGAEVQDDGLFLYSHHGSDPCSDMLVNAFDLVRIHKFGDLEENEGDGTPMAHRQSWKKMIALCEADSAYRKERTKAKFDTNAMFDSLWDEDQVEVEEATEQHTLDEDIAEVVGLYNGFKLQEDNPVIAILGEAKPIRVDRAKRRPKPPKDWIDSLDTTQQGVLKNTAFNVSKIISHDPRFRDAIGFNEFLNDAVVLKPIRTKLDWIPAFDVKDTLSGEPWQDKHDAVMRTILSAPNGPGLIGWGINPSDKDLGTGLRLAAHNNAFHPVREVLESFTHDGKARAESLFIRWLGCPDTPYYREAARLFLIAAVARIYEPGTKFDYVPVLWGAQGVRKSTFIRILALNWFGELTARFDDEQALAGQMAGCWIMELAELASMAKAQVEDVKVFISALVTKVRLAYDRRVTTFPRQCVFMGSTNTLDFLKDETGNRRFWPIQVMVDSIDTEAFAAEVPQLWAEALKLYRAMRAENPHGELKLTLSREALATAQGLQEKARRRTDLDFVVEVIQPILDAKVRSDEFGNETHGRRQAVSVMGLHAEVLDSGLRVTGSLPTLIGQALGRCGWVQRGRTTKGGRGVTTIYGPGPEQEKRWAEQDALTEAEDVI